MGLLDSLFNSDSYGGQQGGLLNFLRQMQMQQQNYQPSAGFSAEPSAATFADRFNAMPPPQTPVPELPPAQTIAPAPQPAALPPQQNYAPPQGQMPTDVSAQSRQPQQQELPPALGGRGGGGFLDNLSAGFQSIGNGGGIISALSGHPNDPQSIAQQDRRAQYQAFVGAGLSPQNAMLAVLNPEAGKILIQQALSTKQKWGETGTDIYGNRKYGFINENDQTVNGKPLSAQGQASGGGMTGIDEARPIYDQLPKAQQTVVDNMLAGRLPPPGAQALRSPYWNTMMSAAAEKAQSQGGTFDATNWAQRQKTAKDFSPSGTAGVAIGALNTVQKHIGKLSNDIETLDNGGWTAWNSVRNGIANNTPLDPERRAAVQRVNDDIKAVTDEMARAYKGGHMSDSEIKSWEKLVSSIQSKEQGRQALADFVDLLNGKREALTNQHKDIMQAEAPGARAQENQQITKSVHERNVGVSQSKLPSGWSVQVR